MRVERFLVDTSVWLEVLPPGGRNESLRERIDVLLAGDLVATMGMVRLELLGGARTEDEWHRLGELLSALHPMVVTDDIWEQAAELGFLLRRQGVTAPFTDLLIGAVAMAYDAVVVHRDRHFDMMASNSPLRVESYVAA